MFKYERKAGKQTSFLITWMWKAQMLTEQAEVSQVSSSHCLLWISAQALNLTLMWFKGEKPCGALEVCAGTQPADTIRNLGVANAEVKYLFLSSLVLLSMIFYLSANGIVSFMYPLLLCTATGFCQWDYLGQEQKHTCERSCSLQLHIFMFV